MIRKALAVRFIQEMKTGRTGPLAVAVETDDEVQHEAILKASGRRDLGIEGMANEALASLLAQDVGLPVNEPFLVELTDEWIQTIPSQVLQAELRDSSRYCFASEAAGTGWRIWGPDDQLLLDRRAVALAIFSFDAFIQNDDRRPSNPNLFVQGPLFRIIDHELAFRIRQKILPPCRPWETGNLEYLKQPNKHALFARLQGEQDLDFTPIRTAWAGISDERLDAYIDALPQEWDDAADAMAEAVVYLKLVRNQIDHCIDELKRVLQ